MFSNRKSQQRRAEIRKNRPDTFAHTWQALKESGGMNGLAIAAVFCIIAAGILQLREDVVPYRPGQWVPHDIFARVDFSFRDKDRLSEVRQITRERQPRVYAPAGDVWGDLEKDLLSLPDQVGNAPGIGQVRQPLRDVLNDGSLTKLKEYIAPERRESYAKEVNGYFETIRSMTPPLVILPEDQHQEDLHHSIVITSIDANTPVPTNLTYSMAMEEELTRRFEAAARDNFSLTLQPLIVAYTLKTLKPTHVLDPVATAEARNRAAENVASTAGDIPFKAGMIIVSKREQITQRDWQILRAENEEYSHVLGRQWQNRVGSVGIVVLITLMLSLYVAMYQPRVIRNHARAIAISSLMLSMLLLAQLAAIGSGPIYLFGIAPTLLVAIILAVAYDQRFAISASSSHALLVTIGLDQGATFFIILWVGIVTACYLLDDIRSRSKLIEVSGVTSLAMIVATAAAGAMTLDPPQFIFRNCLYAGAAGLTVGFVVLGILPFIEKAFRITTSMTLLELADASHPLLRRLAVEAPGTYNHSLQVATLSEAAAEAIGANSLLCRVASYYHDVGKINKAEYFVENQSGGQNRHLNLSPSVSLLIIIGHVKDGIELAKEYNLPTSLMPFIQQHHGTTLVEYFYHQACNQQEQRQPDMPAISEMQYRYPGPKPRSREVAILMLADACESATRAMAEPTAGRIEALVHDITMRRLLDGQFDEADVTMREIERIERSLVKTLLGIYHGRIAYPSSQAITSAIPATPATASKTA